MPDFSIDDSKTKDLKMPDIAKQAASNILRDQVFQRKANDSQDLANALEQIRRNRDTNHDALVNPKEIHASSQTANKQRKNLKDKIDDLAQQTEKMLKEKKITFGPPHSDQNNDPKSDASRSAEKKSSVEPKAKSIIKEEKDKQKAPQQKSGRTTVDPIDVAKKLGAGLGGPTAIRIDEIGEPKGDSKLIVAALKLETLDKTKIIQQQIKDLHNDGELNDSGISANDIDDLRELPYATEGLAKLIQDFTKIKGTKDHITDEDILKYVQKNKLDEFTKTCIWRGQHHLQDNEPSGKYSQEFIQRVHNKLLNLKIFD